MRPGIYRIIQEGLTNIRKHADSARVRLELQLQDDLDGSLLTLELRDWGEGFDTDGANEAPVHVGLHSIQERVFVLNGKHRIISTVGEGTVLHAQAIKAQQPQTSVVMLTTYDNPTFMARAVSSGTDGYLLKGIDRQELLAALRAVVSGEMLLTAKDLTRSLRNISHETSTAEDLIRPLSEREVEVLRLLSTGSSNNDMAPLLFITENTVKTHIEHIIRKLGVSDRVQAAVWAARRGLLSPPTSS